MLEGFAHEFLRWEADGCSLALVDQHARLQGNLRAVRASCRGMGKEAVRFRSPYRRLATVWEIQVLDFLVDVSCPVRRKALAMTCARIAMTMLDLPSETIARVAALAHQEIMAVSVRWAEEAGRSGATLDALAMGGRA